VVSGAPYTASVYVRGSGTVRLRVAFLAGGGGAAGSDHVLGGAWERLAVTATPDTDTVARVFVETASAQVATIEAGAWQFEPGPHPTAYLDGSMGAGFAWAGTPDQSASTRSAGRLSLPARPFSAVRGGVALWWRPDHAAAFTRDRVLFRLPAGAGALELRHVTASNRFRFISPGASVEVDAPSFAAGGDLLLSASWTRDVITVGAGEVAAAAARGLGPWAATGRMDLGSTGQESPAAGLHADGAVGPVWWFDGPPRPEVIRTLARASTFPRLPLAGG